MEIDDNMNIYIELEISMLKDVSQQSISHTEIFKEEMNQLVSEFIMD